MSANVLKNFILNTQKGIWSTSTIRAISKRVCIIVICENLMWIIASFSCWRFCNYFHFLFCIYTLCREVIKTFFCVLVWALIASVGWYIVGLLFILYHTYPYIQEKYKSWRFARNQHDSVAFGKSKSIIY